MESEEGFAPPPLPKFKRAKNRFGQEHGPYFVKVGKRKVNLKTESYTIARERAREAFYDGKTTWEDERFYDKKASAPKVTEPSSNPLSDWAADLASAANSASAAKPDQYTAPDGRDVPLLGAVPRTDDESDNPSKPDSKASGTPNSAGEDSTEIPPEMVEGLVRQLSELAVEVQIKGQEWLIQRYAKVQPGVVPISAFGRIQSAKMWESQIKKWLPSDVPLPEWAVAMLLCAMFTIPHQIQNAQPLPRDVPLSE